jgi:hypothetical protein
MTAMAERETGQLADKIAQVFVTANAEASDALSALVNHVTMLLENMCPLCRASCQRAIVDELLAIEDGVDKKDVPRACRH